jgi:hypothetical protein
MDNADEAHINELLPRHPPLPAWSVGNELGAGVKDSSVWALCHFASCLFMVGKEICHCVHKKTPWLSPPANYTDRATAVYGRS